MLNFFMLNFCVEILAPIIMIIAFILIVALFIAFIVNVLGAMKKEEENNNDVCNEPKEDEYRVQRAIIVLGDEKIEIEVDNYDIDDNIVEIESIEGRVFITDIKNVLLISE
mgnify:CR=1 FL=1